MGWHRIFPLCVSASQAVCVSSVLERFFFARRCINILIKDAKMVSLLISAAKDADISESQPGFWKHF